MRLAGRNSKPGDRALRRRGSRLYLLGTEAAVSTADLVAWRYEPVYFDAFPGPGAVGLGGRICAVSGVGTSTCDVMESIPAP